MKPKECVKRTKAKYKSKEVGERNKSKKQNAKRKTRGVDETDKK